MPDLPKSDPIIENPRSPWAPSPKPNVYPLDEFYKKDQRKLPPIDVIAGTQMPEPYKSLLVHNNDMTSTLERFHGARIHLTLLRTWQNNDAYFREVVLALDGSEKRVEFGAIKINLPLFEPEPRQKILDEHFPLGRILADHAVAYHSNPRSFFTIQADAFIAEHLKITETPMLYARRNVLSTPRGETLAEIVEILPP